jgi:hypothetical protein
MSTNFADACPACAPGDPSASPPVGIPERVAGGTVTAHECALCQAAWNTFWREGWPIERLIAPVAPEQAERNRAALEDALKDRSAA